MPLNSLRTGSAWRWPLLLALSALMAWLLELLHLPAALLLGPLIAAAAMAVFGATVLVSGLPFQLAQAVIGTMIAQSLPASIFRELLHDWPLFAAGVFFVILASSFLGWVLTRWQVLPGSTAVWGAAPGGASAMILMAGSVGADIRLVAFMQYLRVVTVVLVATLVARFWVGPVIAAAPAMVWFPPVHPPALGGTLLLIVIGAKLGQVLRIPAGSLLVPLFGGAILNNTGVITIELPPWLLVPAYALVGWQVGSRFDRPILLHAARALPRLMVANLALIGVCAAFAAFLVQFAGIDPLTAYLATSPGGVDSIAIIGMAGKADMAFVMAMQTSRFLVVMLIGPWIARLVAASADRRRAPPKT